MTAMSSPARGFSSSVKLANAMGPAQLACTAGPSRAPAPPMKAQAAEAMPPTQAMVLEAAGVFPATRDSAPATQESPRDTKISSSI